MVWLRRWTTSASAKLLREYLGRVVEHQTNGFTALNTAFAGNGAFVFIPKGVTVESPLHLLFLSQALAEAQTAAAFPRVLVVAEENSSATIIESYAGLDDGVYFTNAVVEVVLQGWRSLDSLPCAERKRQGFPRDHDGCAIWAVTAVSIRPASPWARSSRGTTSA